MRPPATSEAPLVWITGAAGLIGQYLLRSAPARWRIRALTRQRFDLTDAPALRAAFLRDEPAAVIHCAAISRTQECEADPHRARLVNVEVTARLTELAADIPLIFFSTDLVFDGRKGNYTEADPPGPLLVYAETKLQAERVVLRNFRHLVIRTSLNGGVSAEGNRAFNEQLRRQWLTGQPTRLFTDEYRSPIAAVVTARATWELLEREATGLLHLAGSERLSRYEIGAALAKRCPELQPRLEPALASAVGGIARPPDTTLNCTRAQGLLSFPLPRFTDWLKSPEVEPGF